MKCVTDVLSPDGALHLRHSERDGVSNHRRLDCVLNRLFRRRSKKTSKLRVTGLGEGNPRVTGGFPHKWPVTRKICSSDDVIMEWAYKGVGWGGWKWGCWAVLGTEADIILCSKFITLVVILECNKCLDISGVWWHQQLNSQKLHENKFFIKWVTWTNWK